MSQVSVIIVNYKTEAFLPACLESLKKSAARFVPGFVLVDNSPGGGAGRVFRELVPGGRLVENEKNVGYARAVNQGIAASDSEYVFIVNPDTLVGEGSLDALVDFMTAHADAGIVGPKLVEPDGSVQLSCRTFYDFKTILLRRTLLGRIFKNSASVRRHLMLDWDHNSVREVDWVIGAAMMVRRSAIRAVGPMDERFFLYFEDVDWCYRMRAGGWRTYYFPQARVVHHYRRQSADVSFGRAKRAHLESWLRFNEKWSLLLYLAKRNRDALARMLLLAADVGALALSFYVAYQLRANLGFVLRKPTPAFDVYASFMLLAVVVGIGSMAYFGLYGRRVRGDWIDLTFDVSRAMLLTSVILMASTFLLYVKTYSRAALLMLLPTSIVVATAERLALRLVQQKLTLTRLNLRRILVVGSGEIAESARAAVAAGEGEGLELAGFIDGGALGETGSGESGPDVAGILQAARAHRASEIVIADTPSRIQRAWALTRELSRRGLQVSIVTELGGLLNAGDRIEELGNVSVVALRKRTPPGGAVKRASELVLSLAGLAVLVVPTLVGVLGLLILGRKPVFKRRAVLLEHGEIVKPLVLNCEGSTRLETSLVSSGLAYTPLLLSVLSGTLALVGVKPESPAEPHASPRAGEGKPGVLGPWRLARTSGEGEAKDKEYLGSWSLSLDLKIIVRSILARPPGA
ncbi:MAG: glycosyltransferase [Candidatus Eisenbacteria bacterium]